MRMLVFLLIKYSCLIQEIDADLSGTVDDLFVAHDDAHMGDDAVLITEESQVARLRLLQEIHQLALPYLLRGIARQKESRHAGADLYQARAVDAHGSTASPKVGSAEQQFGIIHHHLWMEFCGHFNGIGVWLIKRCAKSQKLAIVFGNRLVD